jgi:hypothetical protein
VNRIPISAVGQFGIITDLPPHEMPLNAWTAGKNVKMRDGSVEKFTGHVEAFGLPLIPPIFVMGVPSPGLYRWLYAGTQQVYTWDGANHINITRWDGVNPVFYAATEAQNWTGGILGGIPILNNGIDIPQMWLIPDSSSRLADLANWPSNTVAGAMRVFKSFLVAMDITTSGTRNRHIVKWSHPTAPGTVPDSWDPADETRDAGEYIMSESPGAVLDSLPLRDVNIIYKEDEVWGQQFIGGNDIFRFFNIFRTIGGLSRRCAGEIFAGTHILFGANDCVTHNGQSAQSILDKKTKRYLYSKIDSDSYQTSYIALNLPDREVWFCYPETGNTLPNIAMIWNYFSGAISFRDLPTAAHIGSGLIDLANAPDIWSTDDGTWADWSDTWGERRFNPSLNAMLIADPRGNRMYRENSGEQFAGVDFQSYVERIGLGFPLKTESPPDFLTEKFVTRIWPRIKGTPGGIVKVSVGSQEHIEGPVTWRPAENFIIGTSISVEVRVTSRLHALRFESDSNIHWQLSGYDYELRPAGKHYGG